MFWCVWRIVGTMNNHHLFSESTLRRVASPCSCGVQNRPRVDKFPPALRTAPESPWKPAYAYLILTSGLICYLPTIYSTYYFSSLQHALPHCYHTCDNKTPKMARRHRAHTYRATRHVFVIKPPHVRGRPGLRY